jgi:hypothetical protein
MGSLLSLAEHGVKYFVSYCKFMLSARDILQFFVSYRSFGDTVRNTYCSWDIRLKFSTFYIFLNIYGRK